MEPSTQFYVHVGSSWDWIVHSLRCDGLQAQTEQSRQHLSNRRTKLAHVRRLKIRGGVVGGDDEGD